MKYYNEISIEILYLMTQNEDIFVIVLLIKDSCLPSFAPQRKSIRNSLIAKQRNSRKNGMILVEIL